VNVHYNYIPGIKTKEIMSIYLQGLYHETRKDQKVCLQMRIIITLGNKIKGIRKNMQPSLDTVMCLHGHYISREWIESSR
jgi:hypothetical protein